MRSMVFFLTEVKIGRANRIIPVIINPSEMGRVKNAKGSPIDPTNRGGVVTKIGIDATRPLKGRFPQINFSEGLDWIDLAKIFQP